MAKTTFKLADIKKSSIYRPDLSGESKYLVECLLEVHSVREMEEICELYLQHMFDEGVKIGKDEFLAVLRSVLKRHAIKKMI